jgi:hypothetical protein
VKFDTVGEEFYREAIDLLLNGIDPTLAIPAAESDGDDALISEAWPIQFRAEAQRYRPKGQRLLAATQWPAIVDGFRRELAPGGALLVTERELVLISEEKSSPRLHRTVHLAATKDELAVFTQYLECTSRELSHASPLSFGRSPQEYLE